MALILVEYRALRDEITVRVGSRMTLVGVLAAGAALLVGDKGRPNWVYGLAGFLVLAGAVVWYWSGRMLARLSAHIARLEEDLNELALEAYGSAEAYRSAPAPLLSWETVRTAKRHRP